MKNTSKILALVLVVMTVLMSLSALTVSAADTRTIYLNAGGSGLWDQAGAWFDAWVWGSTTPDAWYTFTDADSDGVYEIEIPADATGMTVHRKNPASKDHNHDNSWNKTGDITISADTNLITITGWNATSFKWGTYTPPATPVTHIYTIAGDKKLCGTDWDVANTANNMTDEDGDSIFEITFENVAKGDYAFKVVTDNSWNNPNYGKDGGNYTFSVYNDGATVKITFNAGTKEIIVDTGEEAVEVEYTYTVSGSAKLCGVEWNPEYTGNDLTKNEDGTYSITYTGIAAGSYEFKVCRNHAYSVSYPAQNYVLKVDKNNTTVTITLDPTTGTITVDQNHVHVWSDATCTDPQKCSCGETQGEALGHDKVVDVEAVDPTCTTAGKTEGSHCSRCDTQNVVSEEVPALGHDKVVDVEAKAPTCTTAGNTEGSHCSRCDAETVVATEIPATGHDDNFIALGVCTKCYTFNYWLVGDNAITVTESHPLTTAGNPVPYEFRYIYITEAGHYVFYTGSEYTPATIFTTPVAADGKVDTSKYSFNIAWLEPGVYWVGVNFYLGVGEYTLNVSKVDCTTKEVTVDPTCTAEGSYVKSCELCGHVFEQKVLPAAGHTEVVDAKVDATCTETGLTEGKHCSVCNEVIVAQEEVPSLGHDWSEGNECSRCQAPKCAHEWSETVVAPTCVKDGYTLHTCSKCGENYKDTTVSATGSHTWVETVVPPTCTEAGSKTNTCSVCEETKTEEIPATGHFYVIGICQNPGCTDKLNMLQLGANTITVPQGMLGNYEFRYITITEAGWYQISCNNPLLITCIFIDNIYAEDSDFSIAEDGTLGESWNGEEDYGSLVYLEEGTYVVGLYYTFVSAPGDYTVNIDAHEHSYTEGKCVCGAEDPDYVPEDPGQQPGGDEPSEPSDPSDDPSDEPTTPAPELTLWDKIVAFLKKILAMILGFFKK